MKVKDDGTVKVLDFGLAKALDPHPTGDPSQSPTLTAAATQMGVIMGTAAYMSPEQARGKTVDKRADIWAFGAVLFEMLTGKRAFVGDDVSLTLAKVLEREPSWESLPDTTPPNLRNVLQRCLEKEPKQRIQAIGDVRLAMEGAFESSTATETEFAGTAPLRWQRALASAVSVGVLASVVTWAFLRPVPLRPERFAIALPSSESLYVSNANPDLVISPDATRLVYRVGPSAGGPLALHTVGQLSTTLFGFSGISAFMSPDGESVGFWEGEDLRRVSVLGGVPSTICRLPSPLMRGASWSTDDSIIFGTSGPSGLWHVPASGGVPEELTTPEDESGSVNHIWPDALPEGRGVLFTVVIGGEIDSAQIAVLDFETGEQTTLISGGSTPRYVPTGHLVYAVRGALHAPGFDLDRLAVTPGPVSVLEGVVTKTSGAASFSFARDGTLAYVPGIPGRVVGERIVVWMDRAGQEDPLPGLERGSFRGVRVSPDGTRIALDGWGNVSIYDVDRGTASLLTVDAATDSAPLWTPDGEHVVFGSNREGPSGLFWVPANGDTDPERLLIDSDASDLKPQTWSADGSTLVYGGSYPDRAEDLGLLAMDGDRQAESWLQTEFSEAQAVVSPDGEWVAYSSTRSGQRDVYVERFPGLGDRHLISTDGGHQPVWAPDGSQLFYLTEGDTQLMVASIDTSPVFAAGVPEVLFEERFYTFRDHRSVDIMPDGLRFVMVKHGAATSNDERATFVLVRHWFEELTRLVSVP